MSGPSRSAHGMSAPSGQADCVVSLGEFRRQMPPDLLAALPWFIAYSGGLDSTALLMASVELGISVRAIHVNHHLQAAAADMQAHCERMCARHGVALDVLHADVQCRGGDSIEAQARQARYEAIAQHVRASTSDRPAVVLTAHHRDDQLETVLITLFRGSGLEGLAGMLPLSPLPVPGERTVWLARPFLQMGRDDIAAQALQMGWEWFDDPTNDDVRLRRNWIRRQALPLIREHFPQVDASLLRLSRQMADARDEWDDQAQRLMQQCEVAPLCLSRTVWSQFNEREQVRLLRYWLAGEGLRLNEARTLQLREQLLRPQGGVRQVADEWGVEMRSGQMRIVRFGKQAEQTGEPKNEPQDEPQDEPKDEPKDDFNAGRKGVE